MTEPHEFAVMLLVRTADPRLTADAVSEAMETARGVATLRRAVLQHLPKDVSRVVAVFPVEHAQMLMQLHDAVGQDIAAHLRKAGVPVEDLFVRAPADYIPPTTE